MTTSAGGISAPGDVAGAGREAAIGPVVLTAERRAELVSRAGAVAGRLGASGARMVALCFVDNAGIARVKAIPYAGCQRSFARRMADEALAQGLTARVSFEVEWALGTDQDGQFGPACTGPAYGMTRLREAMGDPLFEAFLAVRRGETELFADRSADEIVARTRWRW